MRPVAKTHNPILAVASLVVASLAFAPRAHAHCDTVDGPLVREAQAALDSGDLTPVLKWISPADQGEVQAAFSRVREVRTGGDDARAVGDQFFLETVVRLHRQSEGAPYTGLKPAGSIPPLLAAADTALDTGDARQLADELAEHLRQAVLARFDEAHARRAHADHNVEAGRAYLEAYVAYMHLVERVQEIVTPASEGAEAHAGHAH